MTNSQLRSRITLLCIFIILFLPTLNHPVFGQFKSTTEVSIGPNIDSKYGYSGRSFLVEGKLVSIKTWNKQIIVEITDAKTLQNEISKVHEIPFLFHLQDLILRNNRLFIMYSPMLTESGTHKSLLYSREISCTSGEWIGDDRPFLKSSSKARQANDASLEVESRFQTVYSPDSSKTLVYYTLVNNMRGSEDHLAGMAVIDDDNQLEWQSEIELPFPNRDYSIFSRCIDNSGNIYLFGRLAIPVTSETPRHTTLTMLKLSNKGKITGPVILKFPFATFSRQITLTSNNDGSSTISALGFDKENRPHLVLFNYKGDDLLEPMATYSINDEIVQTQKSGNLGDALYGENDPDKELKNKAHFIKKVTTLPNKQKLYEIEDRFIVYQDDMKDITSYGYTLMLLDTNDQVKWVRNFPKFQNSGYFLPLSTYLKVGESRVHLIFFENSENLKKQSRDKPKEYKFQAGAMAAYGFGTSGAALMDYSVELETGAIARNKLFVVAELPLSKRHYIWPKYIHQLDLDTYAVEARTDKGHAFLKFKINE